MLLLALITGCDRAETPPEGQGVTLAFELTDEAGTRVTRGDFSARLQLVFFGFTSCPDICPITLHNVAAALRAMGSTGEDVAVLFISVDPKRDTPERLVQYTSAFHESVVGLTGSWQELVDVTTALRTTFGFSVSDDDGRERALSRVEYEALTPADAYTPFHSSLVYVVAADGSLLDTIGYGAGPDRIESVIRENLR